MQAHRRWIDVRQGSRESEITNARHQMRMAAIEQLQAARYVGNLPRLSSDQLRDLTLTQIRQITADQIQRNRSGRQSP